MVGSRAQWFFGGEYALRACKLCLYAVRCGLSDQVVTCGLRIVVSQSTILKEAGKKSRVCMCLGAMRVCVCTREFVCECVHSYVCVGFVGGLMRVGPGAAACVWACLCRLCVCKRPARSRVVGRVGSTFVC